ncbi:MAG: glycosyltransferase family 2 protein [Coriobacteriales bacterium]|nr:glycosyltransferase family 2 protein [Coriobacteriales bacterium]
MADFITTFNYSIFALFTLCFLYQGVYILVALFVKPKEYVARTNHRYAALISGRNESAVIGNLVRSLKEQDYPSELLDIYVIADNCTDDTARVAREAGAFVFERFDQVHKGKSWALDYALKRIFRTQPADARYEGYFVFDADNVVDKDFVRQMNANFDNGQRIVTSYRNSKNFDTNWISAGYSLWFLREGKYLSQARATVGSSCHIGGTGFLISADILERDGGWIHHLLTEDIEFSVDSVIQGETIGYCPKAMVYDEQPVTFAASWNQRMRWAKGFYQVLWNYGGKLFAGIFKQRRFACYDMFVQIAPAMLITVLTVLMNCIALAAGMLDLNLTHEVTQACLFSLGKSLLGFMGMMLVYAVLVNITERKNIHCPLGKRIEYILTFPFFMITYIPIAVCALFKKVEWKPIAHTVSKSVAEIAGE